ncbi:hypothetical protein [Micromonospora profundi]|uniref:hypothetical protein n=1 Tax=Micromonospora profundi TaxID=1420889 RepID=UPI0036675496
MARLSAEELQALRGPDGWMQMSSVMIRSRREVRRQLGIVPDLPMSWPRRRHSGSGSSTRTS